MKLEPDIIKALKILDRYFRAKGIKYVLIGAQVPKLLITSLVSDEHRPTRDVDVTLQLEEWSDYKNVKNELLVKGFREGKFELRFIYEETLLDIVPYLQKEMKSGVLHLPHSENSMNLSGFDRLFTNAVLIDIETDFRIPVVPLHLFVFTKMLAFLDRGVSQNITKDLEDIIFVLENYETQSERRFDTTIPSDIDYKARGAYLLGYDLKQYLTANERKTVSAFFNYFEDEYSAFLQKLSQYDQWKRKELFLMFTCFQKGIQS